MFNTSFMRSGHEGTTLDVGKKDQENGAQICTVAGNCVHNSVRELFQDICRQILVDFVALFK